MSDDRYTDLPAGPLPTLAIQPDDRYYRICSLALDSEVPTEAELAEISRYAWYHLLYYYDHVAAKALADGLKISGHNTVVFRKADNHWTYRRISWTKGPMWWPNDGPLGAVIAHLEDMMPERWRAFQERHPLPGVRHVQPSFGLPYAWAGVTYKGEAMVTCPVCGQSFTENDWTTDGIDMDDPSKRAARAYAEHFTTSATKEATNP